MLSGRQTQLTIATVFMVASAAPAYAEMHCGLNAKDAPDVKMWELQPAKDRKTTIELITSIVTDHHFYKVCLENGVTVVLRMTNRRHVETVYFVKD